MKHTFLTLWLAGVVSSALALPYVFALQHEALVKAPVSLTQIGLMGIAQVAILLAIAIYVGLKLSERIQLRALVLFTPDAALKEDTKNILKLAAPIGIAVALLIKFADIFFAQYVPQIIATVAQIPFWKALLVAPYGGVVEELLMRLLLVTLFAWLLGKITKVTGVAQNSAIMWSAIVLATIVFGLGHLPATATMTALTPIVIARALILNGIGGIAFGWLYWKRGLEYAIMAHFTTDVVLHAIIPALLK